MLKKKVNEFFLVSLLSATFVSSCAVPSATEKKVDEEIDNIDRYISAEKRVELKDFETPIQMTLDNISELTGIENVDAKISEMLKKSVKNAKCITLNGGQSDLAKDPSYKVFLDEKLARSKARKTEVEEALKTADPKYKDTLQKSLGAFVKEIESIEKYLNEIIIDAQKPKKENKDFYSEDCSDQRKAFHALLSDYEDQLEEADPSFSQAKKDLMKGLQKDNSIADIAGKFPERQLIASGIATQEEIDAKLEVTNADNIEADKLEKEADRLEKIANALPDEFVETGISTKATTTTTTAKKTKKKKPSVRKNKRKAKATAFRIQAAKKKGAKFKPAKKNSQTKAMMDKQIARAKKKQEQLKKMRTLALAKKDKMAIKQVNQDDRELLPVTEENVQQGQQMIDELEQQQKEMDKLPDEDAELNN
jgi:hypothetical protein